MSGISVPRTLEIYRYACHPRHAYDSTALADGAHSSPRTITRWHKSAGPARVIQNAPMASTCLSRYKSAIRRDTSTRFHARRNYHPVGLIFRSFNWTIPQLLARRSDVLCAGAQYTLACAYREKALSKQHRQPRLADRRNCVRRGRLYRGIVKRIILSPVTWRKFTVAEMATWVLNFCRRGALRG